MAKSRRRKSSVFLLRFFHSSSRALEEGVVIQDFRNLYLKGFKEPGRKVSGEPDELTLVSDRGRIPTLDELGI